MNIKEEFMSVKVEIVYTGFDSVSEWKSFKWAVMVNGVLFRYSTGEGLCTLVHKDGKLYNGTNKKPARSFVDGDRFIHIPKAVDVLDSLFRDATCGYMTFDDFCDSLGYDSDSIKAFSTYQECCKTRSKLKTALGSHYNEIETKIMEMEL